MGRSRQAAIVAAIVLVSGAAGGQSRGATLSLKEVEALDVGERSSLTVELSLPPSAARPLLLTADAEGAAVDVVQGRLMRGDAQDEHGSPLQFRVPIVARGEGQSVVRVRVDAYVCDPRCQPLQMQSRTVVQVRRSPPS